METVVDEDGREIDIIVVPGRPPEIKMEAASVPDIHIAGVANSLLRTPAFDWSYGCSATSAAMMFGYYDNDGYHTNMYAGGTNAGVCIMDNSVWGQTWWVDEWYSECPLSATHDGVDGRTIYGHVDDYWVDYLHPGPDPWIGNWTEHTYGDCTGDYMGTNQSSLNASDGSTWFAFWPDGSPTYDPDLSSQGKMDGCRGMRLFVESRGYSVATNGNFNQYIYGYGGNTLGFTFAQYMAEIDAGRPVLIQVAGHTMLGYGYDSDTNKVYLHDTWDHIDHEMTWGGYYSGMVHYAVTVFRLQTVSEPVWESYQGNYRDAGGNVDDYFEEYASENDVYMYGSGFTPGETYKVIYWDGSGDDVVVELATATGGIIKSTHSFTQGTDAAGNWHVTVYDQDANPSSYSASDEDIVADDTSYGGTSFGVAAAAIPEFPTPLVAFAVMAACAGIYLWMRRKAAARTA